MSFENSFQNALIQYAGFTGSTGGIVLPTQLAGGGGGGGGTTFEQSSQTITNSSTQFVYFDIPENTRAVFLEAQRIGNTQSFLFQFLRNSSSGGNYYGFNNQSSTSSFGQIAFTDGAACQISLASDVAYLQSVYYGGSLQGVRTLSGYANNLISDYNRLVIFRPMGINFDTGVVFSITCMIQP